MSASASQTWGLIAGWGGLPRDLARAARRRGHRVVAVAFRGLTYERLGDEVDAICWLRLGELEALIAGLRQAGAGDAVMAGMVPKTMLFEHPEILRPDARAVALIGGLGERGDDAILKAIAETLEAEGIRVRGQGELVPELLAPEGTLTETQPSAEQLADVRYAWPIAKAIGSLDVGQTLVVRDRAVLAVEAIEGTDAAIRRGGALGRAGACVVKLAKPTQDPRFDLPAVGPQTVAAMAEVKAGVLAVEAGRTLLLERARLLQEADAHGICVLGWKGDAAAPSGSGLLP